MKWLFSIGFAMITNIALAQISSTDGNNYHINYSDGRLANSSMPPEAIGTPFLTEDWNVGTVVFKNKVASKDIKLKYNILDNKLLFLDSTGDKTMEFSTPIKEFFFEYSSDGTIRKAHYCAGLPPVDGMNGDTFYELLSDGKYVLLRSFKKTVVKVKQAYQPEKDMVKDSREYYVYNPASGKIARLKKKDKKSVAEVIETADGALLDKVVSDNNLKMKSDADLLLLFNFLNEAKSKKTE